MEARTGEVFDLQYLEDVNRAAKLMDVGEIESKLHEVEQAEVDRLQKMSRQQRRAELRKRPAVQRSELERLLREAREA